MPGILSRNRSQRMQDVNEYESVNGFISVTDYASVTFYADGSGFCVYAEIVRVGCLTFITVEIASF